MSATEIQKIEMEMMKLSEKLLHLRRDTAPTEVKNYTFKTPEGDVTLLQLFAGKDRLFAIHNMGQACRYCTLWADGINGFVPHLEEKYALVVLSKDPPEVQRRFANSRQWRFKMASHGGGEYAKQGFVTPGEDNTPGLVVFERKGDKIYKKNATTFGPGDQFCSIWPILSLAGISEEEWTPQYNYWKRPEKMEDGGQNLN